MRVLEAAKRRACSLRARGSQDWGADRVREVTTSTMSSMRLGVYGRVPQQGFNLRVELLDA